MKRNVVLFFFMLTVSAVFAQKTIINQPVIWYTYQLNLKINERITIQSDVQERHFIHPLKQGQLLLRSSLKITLKHRWDIGPGFSFILSNKDPTVDYNFEVPELRPHLDINNSQSFNRVNLSHRYRLESRFFKNSSGNELTKGFSFGSMRFRYFFDLDIFLIKPKEEKNSLRLRLSNELMLNFGNKIKYNLFDQNRASIMLNYTPIHALSVEVGYINWFQQRTSGNQYFSRNIFRVGIIQNIKIKDKKVPKE